MIFLSLSVVDERARLFIFRLFTLSKERSLRVVAVVGVVVDVDDELIPVVAWRTLNVSDFDRGLCRDSTTVGDVERFLRSGTITRVVESSSRLSGMWSIMSFGENLRARADPRGERPLALAGLLVGLELVFLNGLFPCDPRDSSRWELCRDVCE